MFNPNRILTQLYIKCNIFAFYNPEKGEMRIYFSALILLFTGSGCVKSYEFKNKDVTPALVIEGQISNISFYESTKYPADGRFFTVRLSQTSMVSNIRNPAVKNAAVYLTDVSGNQWTYTPTPNSAGVYTLYDRDFHADSGNEYKLHVILSDGESYESDWEKLPEHLPGPMGNISFSEVESKQFIYINNEKTLANIRGINVKLKLPEDSGKTPIYYKWNFSPTWIYRATLLRPSDPRYRCWISDPNYLSDYVIHKDLIGDYNQDLFYLQIDFNGRIFDRLSVLIHQYSMTEDYYNYWQEIHEQGNRKGLFDPPPFNLHSNLHSVNPSLKVYGYFGVVEEQIKRWNISRTDLSYPVKNTWKDACNPNVIMISPYSPCINCFNASDYATNQQPDWWEK